MAKSFYLKLFLRVSTDFLLGFHYATNQIGHYELAIYESLQMYVMQRLAASFHGKVTTSEIFTQPYIYLIIYQAMYLSSSCTLGTVLSIGDT